MTGGDVLAELAALEPATLRVKPRVELGAVEIMAIGDGNTTRFLLGTRHAADLANQLKEAVARVARGGAS